MKPVEAFEPESIETYAQLTLRDSRLKSLADGIADAAKLGIYRAIGHTVDPKHFGVPSSPGTFESAASRLFRQWKPERQERVRTTLVKSGLPEALSNRGKRGRIPSQGDLASTKSSEDIVFDEMKERIGRGFELSAPDVDSGLQIRAPIRSPVTFATAIIPPGTSGIVTTGQTEIDKKYSALGGPNGFLGMPITGLGATPGNKGCFRHYQRGSIYYSPASGAHEVHGLIREKWKTLGWEQSFLGFPTTDESTTPDTVGRYNHFQGGSIYWTPNTGAHEVHGQIRNFWEANGWERGYLKYPLTDELPTPDGKGRRSVFQGGSVYWYADKGAYAASTQPVSKVSLRLLRVHCVDETTGFAGSEIGSDEIHLAGAAIDPYGNASKFDVGKLGNFNDGAWSGWPPKIACSFAVNHADNVWPKLFASTMILCEKDEGGLTDFALRCTAKAQEIAKQKLKEFGATGVTQYIISVIAAYAVDHIYAFLKDVLRDDLFVPVTAYTKMAGPAALFQGGAYDSADGYCWVKGHGGHYEWWHDWVLT